MKIVESKEYGTERTGKTANPGEKWPSGKVHDLARTAPLSGAQQIRLARRAHAGDERARSKLVRTNMRLVFSVANKYRGEGIAFEDLVSEGTAGLVEGIRRFDPDAGYRLSTYATFWIRRAVLEAWLWHGRTIRVPRGVHDDLHTLGRVREELLKAYGREPTPGELAEGGSFSNSRVEELIRASRLPASLDAPAGRSSRALEDGEKSALGELLADEALTGEAVAAVLRGEHEAALARAMEKLPEPDRYIINARYGLDGTPPATLKELGADLGISPEGVRQRQRAVEASLRRRLHAYGEPYGKAS